MAKKNKPEPADTPLSVDIEDDQIVIRVGINVIAMVAEKSEKFRDEAKKATEDECRLQLSLRSYNMLALMAVPMMGRTYACDYCGRADGLDCVLPDETWKAVSEFHNNASLLCTWCIDRAARQLGITAKATLHFAGDAITGTTQSDADGEHVNRLAKQVESLAADLATMKLKVQEAQNAHTNECTAARERIETLQGELVQAKACAVPDGAVVFVKDGEPRAPKYGEAFGPISDRGHGLAIAQHDWPAKAPRQIFRRWHPPESPTEADDQASVRHVGPYKGYRGKAEWDPEAGLFHGEVGTAKDVITFSAKTQNEIYQAFKGSVDDYLSYCEALKTAPESPSAEAPTASDDFRAKVLSATGGEAWHTDEDIIAHIKATEKTSRNAIGEKLEQLNTEWEEVLAVNPKPFGAAPTASNWEAEFDKRFIQQAEGKGTRGHHLEHYAVLWRVWQDDEVGMAGRNTMSLAIPEHVKEFIREVVLPAYGKSLVALASGMAVELAKANALPAPSAEAGGGKADVAEELPDGVGKSWDDKWRVSAAFPSTAVTVNEWPEGTVHFVPVIEDGKPARRVPRIGEFYKSEWLPSFSGFVLCTAGCRESSDREIFTLVSGPPVAGKGERDWKQIATDKAGELAMLAHFFVPGAIHLLPLSDEKGGKAVRPPKRGEWFKANMMGGGYIFTEASVNWSDDGPPVPIYTFTENPTHIGCVTNQTMGSVPPARADGEGSREISWTVELAALVRDRGICPARGWNATPAQFEAASDWINSRAVVEAELAACKKDREAIAAINKHRMRVAWHDSAKAWQAWLPGLGSPEAKQPILADAVFDLVQKLEGGK